MTGCNAGATQGNDSITAASRPGGDQVQWKGFTLHPLSFKSASPCPLPEEASPPLCSWGTFIQTDFNTHCNPIPTLGLWGYHHRLGSPTWCSPRVHRPGGCGCHWEPWPLPPGLTETVRSTSTTGTSVSTAASRSASGWACERRVSSHGVWPATAGLFPLVTSFSLSQLGLLFLFF